MGRSNEDRNLYNECSESCLELFIDPNPINCIDLLEFGNDYFCFCSLINISIFLFEGLNTITYL